MRRWVVLAVFLLTASTLTACSGGDGGAEAITTSDPAGLTSAAETGDASGAQPPAGSPSPATAQLDPAAALEARDSLIACLASVGYPSAPLESQGARMILPLTTSNIGIISIVSSDDPPEDILAEYSGDVAAIHQEPHGVYVEGWTIGTPEDAVLIALDACYTQTGLPANDRAPAS